MATELQTSQSIPSSRIPTPLYPSPIPRYNWPVDLKSFITLMNGYGVADLPINPFLTNTYPFLSLPHSTFVQLTSRPKKFHIATPAKHCVNYQDFHKLNFIARFKFIFQTQQTDRDPKSRHRIHTPHSPPHPTKKRKPWGSNNEFHRVRNILTTANDKSKQPTDTWKQEMATALQQSETRERRRREQEGEHQTLTLHQALTPQTPSLHLSRWFRPSDGDEDCYVRTVHPLQFVALGFFCSGKASI